MASDKQRELQERIAECFGRGGNLDPYGGRGTSPSNMTTQDVAAVLGVVKTRCGAIGAMVLETHYGGVTDHMMDIARIWDSGTTSKVREERQLRRLGAMLAVREMSGGSSKAPTTELAQYAWMMFSQRDRVVKARDEARDWLTSILNEATPEFRRAWRERKVERITKKQGKAA